MPKSSKTILKVLAVGSLLLFSAVIIPVLRRSAHAKTAEAKVAHQTTNGLTGECIDLTPYINAALADSIHSAKSETNNSLAEMPKGRQALGGVLFDVEGIIQLMGRSLIRYQKEYPAEVDNIKVGQFCRHIHVLHGTSTVMHSNIKVASVVVNYADGTSQEFDLISGHQAFDYWGIPGKEPTAPDTELAWVGKNPFVKRWRPEESLRLYRTTFENQHPGVMVESVSLKSRLSDAAPFFLGLTVN